MTNMQYIMSMLGCNVMLAVLNSLFDKHEFTNPDLAMLYGLALIAFLVLAFWVAVKRLGELNRTGWWSLLILVPFGWIVICLMDKKEMGYGR